MGVVSRGVVCAGFNSPGIYGSVVKAYDWIKDTLTKESKEGELCPDPADAANTDYSMNLKSQEKSKTDSNKDKEELDRIWKN